MSQVTIERHAALLSLRLNRPERRNAMSGEMYKALTAAIKEANQDSAIRVIMLSGEGKGFCAGNDLNDFIATPDISADSPALGFLRTLSSSKVPLVAAVHGAAVGIGTTVLLHSDLVYAAPSSLFAMPFVNLGLVPEAASSLLVPRMMGHVRAAELLLLGDTFSAQKALDYGLINEIVEEDKVHARAFEMAQKLAEKPPQALQKSRALLKRASAAEVQTTIGLEIEEFASQLAGPEAKEAFAAFFEKRKPDFSKLG